MRSGTAPKSNHRSSTIGEMVLHPEFGIIWEEKHKGVAECQHPGEFVDPMEEELHLSSNECSTEVLQAVPTLAQLELMSSPVSPECESEQTVCGKKQQQQLGSAQYSGEAKISAVHEEYGRKLKHFIDRNQKLQRKLLDQGRRVKRTEEELAILKKTKKEVEETVTLWTEELEQFKNLAHALGKPQNGTSRHGNKDMDTSYTTSDVIELLRKQGNPPGSHAVSILLEAIMSDREVFSAAGAGGDVIGIVALLASVDDDFLNCALADFLGIEKMLMIVCRTEAGLRYLNSQTFDEEGKLDEEMGLHAFARRRKSSITGRFRVLVLNEASFYVQPEGLPAVDMSHPQKILNIPQPGPSKGPCPEGFLGYAVNLLHLNPQQLECYATPSEHGLRESLFFQLFSFLQVYDTKENMIQAQQYLAAGAVSLDGSLLHSNGSLEYVCGMQPELKFPLVPSERRISQQNSLMVSTTNFHQEPKFLVEMMHRELSEKIQGLHEETGYTTLATQIVKVETKLLWTRKRIAALVSEIAREEEKKNEILTRVKELQVEDNSV
ncbi:unnamed protein product [Sphagnum jensenii]|uniref:Uncharacterized protein n=1 Tax=Sphagnum jensenii TaxID=128206 RepID=A0ABP0WUS2_9BRYO